MKLQGVLGEVGEDCRQWGGIWCFVSTIGEGWVARPTFRRYLKFCSGLHVLLNPSPFTAKFPICLLGITGTLFNNNLLQSCVVNSVSVFLWIREAHLNQNKNYLLKHLSIGLLLVNKYHIYLRSMACYFVKWSPQSGPQCWGWAWERETWNSSSQPSGMEAFQYF